MTSKNQTGKASVYVIFLIIWGVILTAAFVFGGENRSSLIAGIGLAAAISFLLMVKSLNEHWAGVITSIKKERITVNRGDDIDWEEHDFAYIKLDSGKTKRLRSVNGWKVGDKLEKKKGETSIQVVAKV